MIGFRRRKKGYALVAVLWATMLLSLIAAVVISQVRFAARIESNEWRRLEIDTYAEAATAIALQALLDSSSIKPPILVGARLRGQWQATSFEYAFEDETGKVDLNEAEAESLKKAFQSVGRSAGDAQELAAAIVNWRNPKRQNGEAPAFRRFQSIAEAKLVAGLDAETFDKVAPILTVYAQTAVTNPDYASEVALRALYLGEPAKIAAALEQRERDALSAVTEFRVRTGAALPALKGRAVTIKVSFKMYGKHRTFWTTVRISGVQDRPVLVLDRGSHVG